MRTIHQGHLPVRTLVLIGMVILITAQAYAQNANARLTITLRNATLKEFVKLIENSTGYSFIYSEEISISHKINLKVKDMPLHEILYSRMSRSVTSSLRDTFSCKRKGCKSR